MRKLPNNGLERTVNCDGRTVRAFAVDARAGVEFRSWSAVQRNRYAAKAEHRGYGVAGALRPLR
jgi:hypothetical protein